MAFRPRYVELRNLLDQHNIDANRVQIEGMTEEGYQYVQQHRDGRPKYVEGTGFRLKTEFVEWPNKELYAQVIDLYYGTPQDGPMDPTITNLKGLDPKAVEAAKATKKTTKKDAE